MQNDSLINENESDNDQGFIPSKITIKQRKQFLSKKDKQNPQSRKEFIPRYITEGIMRKQPQQCYKRFSKYDYIQESINSSKTIEQDQYHHLKNSQNNIELNQQGQEISTQRTKTKQKQFTPYDKYIGSGQYILAYSRYKDLKFSNDEINFANNEVKLDCLKSTEELKFKLIKPFQIIKEKRQSITTQSINRSVPIKQALLQFDSKFECGNLLCAFKHRRQSYTYTLFIQNDTNSYGYNQWFYFSVRNAQTKIKYKFHIVNFRKRHSFFREGNRPVVFSMIDSGKFGMSGYSKRGDNVHYGKSSIVKSYESKEKFYELSFELEFYNEDDCCYISMGLPYSYSKLLQNLANYEQIAKQNNLRFQMQSIGTSIAGNKIPYVTITQDQDDVQKSQIQSPNRKKSMQLHVSQKQDDPLSSRQKTQQQGSKLKKKVILIMGRQHPGQTWSSYLMDQFIHSLVSLNSSECEYLLKNFIIKFIPMINVDGVIAGNFRCDLTGMDLNRNWKNPSSLLHPQIFSIKNQILSLVNQGYKVQTCFDLHGHSKQYNVFCYSCKTDNQQCRILPYIFSEHNEEFHFPSCTFGISRFKQSTARAVIFNIIKNTNVLTVQTSFFGSKIDGKVQVFQPQTFEKMANSLIKGCKSYFSHDQNYQACKQTVKSRLSQFIEYKIEKEDALSGSDSEPSADEIQLIQKLQKIVPKNLISECIEVKSAKKHVKRTKKHSLKRRTFQVPEERESKSKKQSFNSLNKNQTIDFITDSPAKQIKSNWDTIKIKKKIQLESRASHFKKNSVLISHQNLDQSQIQQDNPKKMFLNDIIGRSDHKLSFFSRDNKPNLIPVRLKNESFEIFRDAYNATEKYIKHSNQSSLDEMRNSKRHPSKKIGIFKQAKEKQLEEFPLLCVLSQTKKKNHVEKFKQRRESPGTNLSKDEMLPEKIKTAIQTRTEAIKKLRQKDKNSMEIVSKIWRQNFTRYGMAFSTFKITK